MELLNPQQRMQGILDIHMVPERSNTVKVIVLFDVGGSMDPYIKVMRRAFFSN